MDLSVAPCDDFYRYACGKWVDGAEIPPDRASWSRGFDTVAQRNETTLHEILDAIVAGQPPPGTPEEPDLGSFYRACMDEPGLQKGVVELKAQLKKLARVKDPDSLAAAIAEAHHDGVSPLFGFSSTQDFKDATLVIGEFDQGGLGLPERDFYTRDDERTQKIRTQYVAHIQKMFELLGLPVGPKDEKPDALAKRIMDFETELAKASLTVVERRDPAKLYHRLERKGLTQAAPNFPWARFLTGVGVPKVDQLNVTHPPFFDKVSELVKSAPYETWRAYLAWVWLRSMVPALPKPFQDENFQFASQAYTGAKEDKPRWKKCVAYTDSELGEALAQPFVTKTFGPESKEKTRAMVKQIEQAFEQDLEGLAWMDAATKQKAIEKARAVINKVGYPDKWRTYAGLKLKGASFFTQLRRTSHLEEDRQLKKIGKPLDRSEWGMTPPTVNAYYNPSLNEMVFPAGILQPPFFNADATDAVNFGAMGMVVGHELTHGFDDEGRQFDAKGNLNQWWTPDSDKAFKERAQCVEKQYSQETAVDDLKVKGDLTLGENVADMGGVKLALRAFHEWRRDDPQAPSQSTLSQDQLFFVGFAQAWCGKRRPELMRLLAQTDPHSPTRLRVDMPLENLPDFQRAFSCPAGSPMTRTQRCEVW